MKNKEYQSIIKMIEYIDRAEEYTCSKTFEEFSNDSMMIDATIFVISQIGELVKNLDKDFQKKYPKIKWHVLKGIRNRIIHDYEGINLEIVWAIVKEDIGVLRNNLEEILENENNTI